MRKLLPTEIEKVSEFFSADRPECKACPYTAKVYGKIQCGMVYYDCMVSRPVCLEEIR